MTLAASQRGALLRLAREAAARWRAGELPTRPDEAAAAASAAASAAAAAAAPVAAGGASPGGAAAAPAAAYTAPAIVWVKAVDGECSVGGESGKSPAAGAAAAAAAGPVAAYYGAGAGARRARAGGPDAAASAARAAAAAAGTSSSSSVRRPAGRAFVVELEVGGATYRLQPLPGDGGAGLPPFLSVAEDDGGETGADHLPFPSRRAAVAAAEMWVAAVDPAAWQLRARDAPWRGLPVTTLQAAALAAQGHAATAGFAAARCAAAAVVFGGPLAASPAGADAAPSAAALSGLLLSRGAAADAIDAQRLAQARAPSSPEAIFLAEQLAPWALPRYAGAGGGGGGRGWEGGGGGGGAGSSSASAYGGARDSARPNENSIGSITWRAVSPGAAAARLYAAAAAAALDAAAAELLLRLPGVAESGGDDALGRRRLLARAMAAGRRAAVLVGGAGGSTAAEAAAQDDDDDDDDEQDDDAAAASPRAAAAASTPLTLAACHAALPARLDAAANARRMWLAGLRPRLALWASAHPAGFGWRHGGATTPAGRRSDDDNGSSDGVAPSRHLRPSSHDLFLDLMCGGYLWLRRVDAGREDESDGGDDHAALSAASRLPTPTTDPRAFLPPPLDPRALYEVTYEDPGGWHHVALTGARASTLLSAAGASPDRRRRRPLTPRSLVLPLPMALARAERLAQQMAADGSALVSRADVARCASMAAGWRMLDASPSPLSPSPLSGLPPDAAVARAVAAPAPERALRELRCLGLPAIGLRRGSRDEEDDDDEEEDDDHPPASPPLCYSAVDADRAAARARRALALPDPPATAAQLARLAELRLVPPPPESMLPPHAQSGAGGGRGGTPVLPPPPPPPLTFRLARFLLFRHACPLGVGGDATAAGSSSLDSMSLASFFEAPPPSLSPLGAPSASPLPPPPSRFDAQARRRRGSMWWGNEGRRPNRW